MHLLVRDQHRLDAQDEAVDLEQTPGDIVFLSFSDSDLGAMAAAHEARPARSLRLASLARLRHPFSVDLYIEKTVAQARFVVVRCLGGADYWRYGIEELAALCRAKNIALAVVPGDARADERLDRASTLPVEDLRLIWRFLDEGGIGNVGEFLRFIDARLAGDGEWREPKTVPAAGRCAIACRANDSDAPRALIVLYRSLFLAGDIAPAIALADGLEQAGFAVEALFVTSLKDARVVETVAQTIDLFRSDVILNTTAFSAREGEGGTILDRADVPVIQASFATVSREAWEQSARGLGAIDLAMNVVMPEVDGRIIGPVISFKADQARDNTRQFSRAMHRPHEDGIGAAIALAEGWTRLRRRSRDMRRLALVMSDYPQKGGREGYAVGLDSLASVSVIADALRDAGYAVDDVRQGRALIETMTRSDMRLPLADYRALFATLPQGFAHSVISAWGDAAEDPACVDGGFVLPAFEAGNLIVALQPDRGARHERQALYHDPAMPPRHAYVVFYLWLRARKCVDAMIHLGTHGTLEWLPGKSVALSRACAPATLVGGLPVVYPFIVNDPGEAAQARRRIAAVTIGHMTPPLRETAGGDAVVEIESLLDEYAQAAGLDPRRADLIADVILERAAASGLAMESGIDGATTRDNALVKLDAWLCGIKELRLGDGLHVLGHNAPGEIVNLLAALDGRFVPPGPAGAPSRARQDVLPTGRNLYGIDPRAVPTRTAQAIGARAAAAVVERFLQDEGDWPRALMIDLWGSSTMRTGGEDFAQALVLLGVRPVWDDASSRVSGFEIMSAAELGRPRVDVTLRISGLFRDVFPGLIALFDQAVEAVAALDEDDGTNPLATARRASPAGQGARIFGAAPGAYGAGLADGLAADRSISREKLGDLYLDAASHAFSARHSERDRDGFASRVKASEALVHTQDMAETDILAGHAFAEDEGGFAAAAAMLGVAPRLYHVDATRAETTNVRSLAEEVARVLRGKFGDSRWLEALMRHGHRGASEIAESIANMALFAVSAECVADASIDLAFDATLGDEAVRTFLERENPDACRAIRADFAMLRARGLWTSRRNSVTLILDGGKAAA
jgi:cobaltochelatase CobN